MSTVDTASLLPPLGTDAKPIEAKSSLKVDIADMALPPDELVAELDNTHLAEADDEDDGETVTLDFVGDELPEESFPLRHPFIWEGSRVDAVTVRQLSTVEMARITRRVAGQKSWDLYEIYAVMTGLPGKVLRSMPALDGGPIVAKAWDFLPPYLR